VPLATSTDNWNLFPGFALPIGAAWPKRTQITGWLLWIRDQ
jgi:hypothetical protein